MVKSRPSKPFWGLLLILALIFASVYIFSVCSSELDQGGHEENTYHPNFHCGVDLTNFVPSKDPSSSLKDFTSRWSLFSQGIKPHLPILIFSVFKIPKPAWVFLHVSIQLVSPHYWGIQKGEPTPRWGRLAQPLAWRTKSDRTGGIPIKWRTRGIIRLDQQMKTPSLGSRNHGMCCSFYNFYFGMNLVRLNLLLIEPRGFIQIC